MNKKYQIAVIGPAGAEEYPTNDAPKDSVYEQAFLIGRLLAENNCIVVTGGKSGIMSTAAEGAKSVADSITVGVVKGKYRFTANEFIDVELVSGAMADGLDEYQIITMCDGVILLGGGAGTLEEIAISYRQEKPMVALRGTGGWADKLANTYLDERKRILIESAETPEQAVKKLLNTIHHRTNSS
jgi:uncharacterized protein (TIGR00725 family)